MQSQGLCELDSCLLAGPVAAHGPGAPEAGAAAWGWAEGAWGWCREAAVALWTRAIRLADRGAAMGDG